MSRPDFRNERSYRRGLVLGLTIAEIIILLIFVLLMALAAALANRDRRIAVLDSGHASRLVEALQRAYPQARNSDGYFRELTRAIDARRAFEAQTSPPAQQAMISDAALGRQVRENARAAGAPDPGVYAQDALDRARSRSRAGEWPPFLSLSEAGGYYFDSGRATLRPEFERNLRTDVIPRLAHLVRQYDVNVVEVIGHTDEVPMTGATNLDASLVPAIAGQRSIASLAPADNAGLAIARAVAVVQILRADPRLRGITVLPLSGAQLIVPVDRIADGTALQSDQARRRIEIRLRRSSERQDARMSLGRN